MKKYSVFIDHDAEDDLFDIYTYVAPNDSLERADKLFYALRHTYYKLKTLPLRGNIPSEPTLQEPKRFRESPLP